MKDYQSPRSYSLMVLKTHSQKEDKSQKKLKSNVIMGWYPVNGKIPLDI